MAVAITHFGGVQAPVVVSTFVVVAVVIVDWMTSVIVVVVVSPPPAPATVTIAVVDVAVLETTNENVECTMPPDGGVTGFGLRPPETPIGNDAASATGELKPPKDCTVTSIFAVPPGFRVRLLGLADRVKEGVPVTVKVPLADFPVLPTARIVYDPGVALEDTMKPMLAFPPPVIVHEDDDRIAGGPAVSWHAVSVVNPVAWPETGVPMGPKVGTSVNVPSGPAATAKVAVAESPAPRFVVTVTMYAVPTAADDETVNPLPAVRLPAASEHDDERKRPPGLAVNWHVVPAKFEPEAVTAVPEVPDVGLRVNVGDKPAVNVAVPVSPVVPVTVTVYGLCAPDATKKDPETTPVPDIAQAALVSRPVGLEDSVHVVSAAAKFEPETRIFAPAIPEDGVTVTVAVTVKGTEIDPC